MLRFPFCKRRRISYFRVFTFFSLLLLVGTLLPAAAETDPTVEISSRILTLFPSFSGKVQAVENSTIVIHGAQNHPVQEGAYLLIGAVKPGGATSPTGALVRVVSVHGQVIRARKIVGNIITQGDQVTGWRRPLRVALVPMSREALQFLLTHPMPKGELDPLRTEDVVAAMIEQGYGDFSAAEGMDLSALAQSLRTPLVLEVKTLSGFGTKLLQFQIRLAGEKEALASFSVMLPAGAATAARPLLPAVPPSSGTTLQPAPLPEPRETGDTLPLQPTPSAAPSPALALGAPAANRTPSTPPILPPLDGFDQPTRWVRILKIREPILSMAAGSFATPGKPEVVLALPGEVRIYSYSLHKNRLKQRSSLEDSTFDSLFWLEAWDLNGDGVDEIIADTDQGVLVLTGGAREPAIVHRQTDIVIRRLGNRLLAQRLSDLRTGEGSIHTALWSGQNWQMDDAIPAPAEANLFGLVSVTGEGPLFVGGDHRLITGGNLVIQKEVGQSNTSALLEIDLPLLARSFSTPQGSLLIRNREGGWPLISKARYTKGGEVLLFVGQAAVTTSPPFRGYLSDLCVHDLDGDGTGEILVSQRVSSLAWDTSAVLRYGTAVPQSGKKAKDGVF